jgi:hypothetical protein
VSETMDLDQAIERLTNDRGQFGDIDTLVQHIAALTAERDRLAAEAVVLREHAEHPGMCNSTWGPDRPCDCYLANISAEVAAHEERDRDTWTKMRTLAAIAKDRSGHIHDSCGCGDCTLVREVLAAPAAQP